MLHMNSRAYIQLVSHVSCVTDCLYVPRKKYDFDASVKNYMYIIMSRVHVTRLVRAVSFFLLLRITNPSQLLHLPSNLDGDMWGFRSNEIFAWRATAGTQILYQ